MSSTQSPNMQLIIPGVGSESGPTYAFDLNASLTLIDRHDHSPGKGVQITPAGLNINTALTLNNNSITNIASAVFTAQSNVDTLQALYVAQGSESPTTNDLWYNDGNGNKVQLTSGGLVNAIIASIPGESYSAGTFTWKQGDGSTTPANFDIGSITLRPTTAGTTNGITLAPPSAIASAYEIDLPLLPVSQSILTIDNLGIMATPDTYPLNALSLASNSVTTAKIVDGAVTYAKLSDTAVVFNSTIYTTGNTFVVPARCTQVTVVLVGGGGGGGGGGGSNGTRGAGGGGGGASAPLVVTLPVTPGSTIPVTVGFAGSGGAAASTTGPGSGGINGGASSITYLGLTYVSYGGGAGAGGGPGDAGTGGAGGLRTDVAPVGCQGGAGAAHSNSGNGGVTSPYAAGGAGGAVGTSSGAGGGGGGGGGFSLIGFGIGTGGAGGAGARAAGGVGSPGQVPPTVHMGAGGGGGGGGVIGGSNNTGGNGADGNQGVVVFYYQS